MKIKKVLVLLMTCILTAGTLGSTVYASTEDQIAAAQAQKQEAQAGLAQAQANISSLESKKQELEAYLAELDAQYNELTNTISQLSVEAAGKEEELKVVQAELEEARKTAEKQYEAMKLRIVYMYEKGGSTLLETLLSSESIADFLNQAVQAQADGRVGDAVNRRHLLQGAGRQQKMPDKLEIFRFQALHPFGNLRQRTPSRCSIKYSIKFNFVYVNIYFIFNLIKLYFIILQSAGYGPRVPARRNPALRIPGPGGGFPAKRSFRPPPARR